MAHSDDREPSVICVSWQEIRDAGIRRHELRKLGHWGGVGNWGVGKAKRGG